MASNSSKATDRARSKRLIHEYRDSTWKFLDVDERRLIQHLADNEKAFEVFARIENDQVLNRLLLLCIEADLILRTFEERVKEAPVRALQLAEYERAVMALRTFLKECEKPLRDRLEAGLPADPNEIYNEFAALTSIHDRIRIGKRIAAETLKRFGATRKRRGKRAAETATIVGIAGGVRRITERRNTSLCADLAELILKHEVTLDQVSNAVETSKREWREP